MDPRTHKILSMASLAGVIVNESEGSRFVIDRVDWDEHVIWVNDNMDEYSLHVDDIDLESDKFYVLSALNPADF